MNKDLTENVTSGCADHSKSTSYVSQCWVMFLGEQANLCLKLKAMLSAVRFNRYVLHETRYTTYCPISFKAACMLEIKFNTVIH